MDEAGSGAKVPPTSSSTLFFLNPQCSANADTEIMFLSDFQTWEAGMGRLQNPHIASSSARLGIPDDAGVFPSRLEAPIGSHVSPPKGLVSLRGEPDARC